MNFENYLLSKNYGEKTIKSYEKTLRYYRRWLVEHQLKEEEIRQADIMLFIQYHKDREVTMSSISRYVNAIKHYYNYLLENGAVLENPTLEIELKGIKRKQLKTVLTRKELDALYNLWDGKEELTPVEQRDRILVGLVVYQGLGTGELNKLELKDVKLREGKIYVKGSRRSNERILKLESHQMLDMMEYTLKVREQLLQQAEKESEKLIVSVGKSERVDNVMQLLLKQLRRKNKSIESINQLRTSVITYWLKIYNLREVQYMAGHRYVSSTEAYLVNDIDDLQEDINKYHPIG